MKKAPSTILATAGVTVGLLGFALPASAATTAATSHSVRAAGQVPGPRPTGRPTGPVTIPTGRPTGRPTGPVTIPTGRPTSRPTNPVKPPTKPGRPDKPGRPGKSGHPGKPVNKQPKPKPICHPQAPKPKYPAKPIGYNKGSNKYKEYTAAVYSWEHPKSGHIVKCDPKPVKHPAPPKHPVKHPAPPKHHHGPKKHWWQGWFN